MNPNNNDMLDIIDDDLDEVVLPKKNNTSDRTDATITNDTTDTSDMSDILNDSDKLKFLELFNSLQSKDPKEIKKMFSKMGINEQQMKQMKSAYENESYLSTETDLRKRLREKLNKKRMMRMNNNIKQEYIDKEEAKKITPDATNNETTSEVKSEVNLETKVDLETKNVNLVTKKTLQNRKKAERKKEKARAQKAATFNSV